MMQSLSLLALSGLFLVSGCASPQPPSTSPTPEYRAVRARTAIRVDGVLDDEAWQHAEVYPLTVPAPDAEKRIYEETGTVRFAWDESFFYVGATLLDRDVIATGKEDGLHHYLYGDLLELFLWPSDSPWYWEMYATPAMKTSVFFFPSPAYLGLESNFAYPIPEGMTTASTIVGTLNTWQDVDASWTTELAVPISELERYGNPFRSETPWRILIGRYNYSVQMNGPGPQLTTAPGLSAVNFHLKREYAPLLLLPPSGP